MWFLEGLSAGRKGEVGGRGDWKGLARGGGVERGAGRGMTLIKTCLVLTQN